MLPDRSSDPAAFADLAALSRQSGRAAARLAAQRVWGERAAATRPIAPSIAAMRLPVGLACGALAVSFVLLL